MDIKVLGIDLGKTVCSLAGLDEAGAVVFRKRLQRHRLLDFLDGLSPCVVAMEACGGAHHIGRYCLQNEHELLLMSPLYVRPYVKVHKNDDRDAEAIADPQCLLATGVTDADAADGSASFGCNGCPRNCKGTRRSKGGPPEICAGHRREQSKSAPGDRANRPYACGHHSCRQF